MQVTVEESSGLNRILKVEIPEDTVKQSVEQRIRKISRQAKIPGFRPGKVPRKLILDRYGSQARQEVISDLLDSSFRDALEEQDMILAGNPEITDLKVDEGQGLAYTASFEVVPEVSVNPCAEMNLKRYQCDISEQDIDDMIEKLREQNRQWNTVERASIDGDRAKISYSYVVDTDDEANKEGSSEEVYVLIGQPGLIPEFDQKLLNTSAGDHLDFPIQFPAEYQHQELAGKKAEFSVVILAVEEPSLPEINTEFIEQFGVQEGTVEAFRKELLSNLEREKNTAINKRQKSEVFQALYDNNSVTLPQVMVDSEFKNLIKPYQEAADKQDADIDDPELETKLTEEARRRVALTLLFGEIIQTNQLKADSTSIHEFVEELASGYEDPHAFVEWYLSDQKRVEQIQQSVLEDKIVSWVLDQAQMSDESLTFTDLMGVDANAV